MADKPQDIYIGGTFQGTPDETHPIQKQFSKSGPRHPLGSGVPKSHFAPFGTEPKKNQPTPKQSRDEINAIRDNQKNQGTVPTTESI